MVPSSIKTFLNKLHKVEIREFTAIQGGSINDAYRYSVRNEEFFVKYNNQVKGIIEKEVDGLKAIASLACISTPEVISFEKVSNFEVLVLPFLRSGPKTPQAWENFGQKLAEMHQKPAVCYGWNQGNFIGSLSQSNNNSDDFITFFISQRLKPQIKLAQERKYLSLQEGRQFEKLFQKLPEIVPNTQPSMVHGDLWSGNFIIGEKEIPYLIDPSIHFNFRETDIAFTYLFGGFDAKFYEGYNSTYPLISGFQERIALYNIYPLLVHLNLFGSGYHGSVMSNLHKYV
jgi:fructosamine-3-kinase